jgi:ORF6N domain.
MDLERIKSKIITVQGQQVILDADVASLYGLETKRINEAVKNNPDKFPEGYILELTAAEWNIMKSKISTSLSPGGKVKIPKAYSEKALYMIATIIKSPTATETTIAIIETFAKVRELSRNIAEISKQTDKQEQKNMLQRSGEIISDIIGDDLGSTGTETTMELNPAVLSVKHTIKRRSKND